MTRADLENIESIIEKCVKQEMGYAEGYIRLNPEDENFRNRIRDNIIEGMNRVWSAIKEEYRKELGIL